MQQPLPSASPHQTERRASPVLQGRLLQWARALWLLITTTTVAAFVFTLPIGYQFYITPCDGQCGPAVRFTSAELAGMVATGLSPHTFALWLLGLEVLFVLVFILVGVLLFAKRAEDPTAYLASLLLVTFGTFFSDTLARLMTLGPLWHAVGWLLQSLSLALFAFVFLLFPNGRFVPRWTVWIATTYSVLMTADTLHLFLPMWVKGVMWGALVITICYAQFYRYRRVSTPEERTQTKWLIWLLTIALVGFFLSGWVLYTLLDPFPRPGTFAWGLAFSGVYDFMLLIPIAFAISIFRYRLWDINILLSRTLVYGGLTVGVVLIYALVVGYFSVLFQSKGAPLISLLASGLVAVLFQPLRAWLQGRANRLIYGDRDDPYTALSRLGQRLEATVAPAAVLHTIVHTVQETLKLPYAAIGLVQDGLMTIGASTGAPVAGVERWPLAYQGEVVGELILGRRSPGESFRAADSRLLDDFARQAGVAAQGVRLTTELQQAREQLITAREEERRRLRRDLHDGVGSALAAQTFKVGAARLTYRKDAQAGDRLLAELESDIQRALTDIRQLVYNLRPPALDELGLVGAIRVTALDLGLQGHGPDGAFGPAEGIRLVLDSPPHWPPIPAAAEVAAYRIAQEALANIVRHAGARTCWVRLAMEQGLVLEIADDGHGLLPQRKQGVGTSSMAERAVELGGTCVVEPRAEGGTRVVARLPLSRRAPAPDGSAERCTPKEDPRWSPCAS